MSIQEPEKSADEEPAYQDTARSQVSLKSSVSNKSTAKSIESHSTNKSESRDLPEIVQTEPANQEEEPEKQSTRSEKSTTESETIAEKPGQSEEAEKEEPIEHSGDNTETTKGFSL